MSRSSLALLAGLALECAASSCTRTAPRPAGVLLITLDTVRADHLGCYGATLAATPVLDAFSNEAVRFDQAMSAVPVTLPSHATMFTDVYPPAHGVRYNGMFKLGEESVTLAERLRDAGFMTGAVPASFPVYAKSGLAQGFETYRDLFSEPGAASLAASAERKAADVTRLGLETIKAAGAKPFFIWLHYYDAHYPYEPPFPYSTRFHDHPYDGEIAYVDAQLGELFSALRTQGLWDRTAVIVAGDHGEGLYDHNERMHGQLAYETTLRVPLLVKAPGARAGKVIHEAVTLADITPTVLDLLALPVPAGLDGISLRPAVFGKEPPRRAIYFEALSGSLNFGWSPIEGLRRGRWKLIRSSDTELYDLESDPSERNDVHAGETTVAADLAATLDRDVAQWTAHPSPAQATAAPLDPGAMAALASLGYIGGNVTETRRAGPSPRTMVHLEGELLLLQEVMVSRLYPPALDAATRILKDDPGNRFALNAAADAAAGLKDLDAAKRYGRELLGRYPEYVPGVVTQGRVAVAEKDYRRAEEIFRAGLEKNAGEPILVYSLALTLVSEGRAAEAQPLVEKALATQHADLSFRVLLADCRAITGDEEGARSELVKAIEAGYKDVQTLRTEPLLAPLRKVHGFEEAVAAIKGA